jgi:hypothetical protein
LQLKLNLFTASYTLTGAGQDVLTGERYGWCKGSMPYIPSSEQRVLCELLWVSRGAMAGALAFSLLAFALYASFACRSYKQR